jgi:hypothetical protein
MRPTATELRTTTYTVRYLSFLEWSKTSWEHLLSFLVTIPWRWWRGGVWFHRQWWSSLSQVFIYRSRHHNEKGKSARKQKGLWNEWEEIPLARVCMKVFTTLVPRSNMNKSCMRVEKWEFVWEFSQLSCPGQTRTRVAWELHESWEGRVCMRDFSTLMPRSKENKSCMRVAWELRRESLHESFLNSHAPVKREQELHESWWELRNESLHESFLYSHAPVKREQELHESWWELRSESLHESFLNSHVLVKREQELHEMMKVG